MMRVALVTGGGAGMGEATAKRLAADGMAVGVLDIDAANARRVAEEIDAAGGRALPLEADIAQRQKIVSAASSLRKTFGPITVLVNNAAIEDFTAFDAIDPEKWDRVMNVNLKGTYQVTQVVLPDMIAARWGRIVNLSAIGAQTGAPNMALYTATKGGVIAMTRSLAVELGRKGITVNTVSPGFIDTPMARRAIQGDRFPVPFEQIVQSYPVPRLGRPEEIAAAVAFFASEDAGYVTGQILGVNGGAAV